MVHFEKSQPAPTCLALEKAKKSGTYRCDGVATKLQSDFKNKCYLCEQKAPTSINIEHFRAHAGNRALEFDWNNLFFACGHCNGTKLAIPAFNDILNCTIAEDRVDQALRYYFEAFPKEQIQITALSNDEKSLNTTQLLNTIYNGKTEIKMLEAANIRDQLRKEVQRFEKQLLDYSAASENPERKAKLSLKIKGQLQNQSAFTAFKRWIVWDNPTLMAEFGQFC